MTYKSAKLTTTCKYTGLITYDLINTVLYKIKYKIKDKRQFKGKE